MKIIGNHDDLINCVEVKDREIKTLSSERIEIIRLLSKEPMYPAQIARQMNMEIQAVYYHIEILKKTGLIKFYGYEQKRGGIAKMFTAGTDAIALIINENGWKKYTPSKKDLPAIFESFISNDLFDAKFVLGSPEPHGKYRARGSEFTILELAMFLGNYATFKPPLYLLDTQVKQNDLEQNLILAGGPKVNTIVEKINSSLKIGFTIDISEVYSKLSKKTYSGNVGIVEVLKNPFSTNNSILVISGLNYAGTRAATLSLLTKLKEIESGNINNNKIIAKVVEGYDEDGDGIVDSVEILE